ncbi:sulfotransferase [Phormidium sp. CCY1219]|uniref:sulfotransferase n=1 Tax=Phormidium sp. CCY1219 TaxID=2886104 RepID=UPI002D1EAD74|nr:sulfotransferase [Phormidium sp. CCY1219]MEB3831300.1 sulfotransferase [Phormidium sp. CCY1219]
MVGLLTGITTASKPPIYIVGLPRTGTTWLASILNTTPGIKHLHEPFNAINVPEAVPHALQYMRADDKNPAFYRLCRQAFSGHSPRDCVTYKRSPVYKILPWWPGRVMVKDVHSYLALDWIDQHFNPVAILVMRHPCAFAYSWFRLYGQFGKSLEKVIEQPKLMNDYLYPFEEQLNKAEGFWEKIGVFWGATYYVMLQQQQKHSDWIWVKHESLCQDPLGEYQNLFKRLDLPWTSQTERRLQQSTTKHSTQPYVPQRITSQEPQKWKNQLEPKQIDRVLEFARPFGLQCYPEL